MGTLERAMWATLPLLVVGTSLTLTASSEERRAGIVTGLQGTASVSRTSLPGSRALNFKDDVYLHDQIVTGDASMARILLGGKALLTVRERSMVRITEAPGVSTVAVSSGRAAINVIRERMQPGDRVEVRTPNATAAIRGTIVVAEVEEDGADTHSTITVLRGLIDVTQHDSVGRVMGQPVSVSALQQVTAAGVRLSPVRGISQKSAEAMAQGYKMSVRPGPPAAPGVVQAELDRAVQQITRETGDKDAVADRDGKDTKEAKDDGKKNDKGGDTKVSDSKGGDKGATGGGNTGGDRVAGGGGSGGDRGGDRVTGGGGGDRRGGGGDRDNARRDRDKGGDRDRGDKGGKDRGKKR